LNSQKRKIHTQKTRGESGWEDSEQWIFSVEEVQLCGREKHQRSCTISNAALFCLMED